ncbi:MAG: tRNA (adenosine(37)-N6)-threonylcarbamoyltransferase complex ATPase subunit type 1 TsaE [Chlamydiota bacterium]|nr:tRNA (adenosine(37)-N6)-threonylcarbamoyltransferase complex ATPase subunit type 1 TsaE [Chlamydiota bacterium]
MNNTKLITWDTDISNGVFSVQSSGSRSTYHIARELGKYIREGDVLCLHGELGAGKTVFAKGIADALGVSKAWTQVVSPTFVLVKEYLGRLKMIHIDLYRIQDPCELPNLGLNEYFYGHDVVLIEWPERCEQLLPDKSIHIYIDFMSLRKRHIRIKGLLSDRLMSDDRHIRL